VAAAVPLVVGNAGATNTGAVDSLDELADFCQVRITVAHYPPGASKWNPIEHRLFSAISGNWQGEPLRDYTMVLNFIRNTTTETGLRVRAALDKNSYPTGIRVTDDELGVLTAADRCAWARTGDRFYRARSIRA
jgi:hypothetical protein